MFFAKKYEKSFVFSCTIKTFALSLHQKQNTRVLVSQIKVQQLTLSHYEKV